MNDNYAIANDFGKSPSKTFFCSMRYICIYYEIHERAYILTSGCDIGRFQVFIIS